MAARFWPLLVGIEENNRPRHMAHKKHRLFAEALDAIGKVSFPFFIPVYFASGRPEGASLWMMFAFHRRNLHCQSVFGFPCLSICGISRVGSFQSGHHDECARRPVHRPRQRRLRRGHNLLEVLHDSGRGRCPDIQDRQSLAGSCAPQGLAASLTDRFQTASGPIAREPVHGLTAQESMAHFRLGRCQVPSMRSPSPTVGGRAN